MKLLYVTNSIDGSGGLERVLSIKTKVLIDEYNYEIHIITLNKVEGEASFFDFSDKIIEHNIEVCGGAFTYIAQYISKIKQVVSKVDPELIFVCDDGLKAFFLPVILRTKVPIVYERHVSKEIEMNHNFSRIKKSSIRIKWFLMEFLAKKFDAFIVLTDGNMNEWKSLKNIKVISNPLSFYPECSSNIQNKKVIAVGKQSYQKGYDLLLKAWEIVVKQHPSWHLDIYGKKDSSCSLEQMAIELNVVSSISFHNPEKEIQDKYLESSIYVMSSRYEGFGMVLIEAMACGLPCVSFDCNYGPSDIIKNNVDGYIVPKGDFVALADKISAIIENLALRKSMGQNAKENVKRYLPINIISKWDNLIKELLS